MALANPILKGAKCHTYTPKLWGLGGVSVMVSFDGPFGPYVEHDDVPLFTGDDSGM